ncbi:hypothetical protein NL676_007071 [Syzygium grande]|nr:hypothetical protein NL676_007071 [Syzygium grande]
MPDPSPPSLRRPAWSPPGLSMTISQVAHCGSSPGSAESQPTRPLDQLRPPPRQITVTRLALPLPRFSPAPSPRYLAPATT